MINRREPLPIAVTTVIPHPEENVFLAAYEGRLILRDFNSYGEAEGYLRLVSAGVIAPEIAKK